MRLFIPEIGTRLTLLADWTFALHFEYRNEKFGRKLRVGVKRGACGEDSWWRLNSDDSEQVTLPAGTILSVSRIYVRQGSKASGYSSLSFHAWAPQEKGKPKGLGRFWVKLADANTIECEVSE